LAITPELVDKIDQQLLNKYDKKLFREFNIFPLYKKEGVLSVACEKELEIDTQAYIEELIGIQINPIFHPKEDIDQLFKRFFVASQSGMSKILNDLLSEGEGLGDISSEDDIEKLASEGPIIKFVNSMLEEAAYKGASDIHIEPYEKNVRLRYRIDGILSEFPAPPYEYYAAIVSRIKIMSNLDITQRRVPQDGQCKYEINKKEMDFRISTVPTIYGESVVIRILNRSDSAVPIEDLITDTELLRKFQKLLAQKDGLILVTGPTGSGKTTTLYSFLDKLNTKEVKILTIEDPVEYKMRGINQVQVNPNIELTFSTGLRAFLRQDPDIIMVGEVRDIETASIAFQASITGHLVLSTLHTNDTVATVTRLIDLGLEDYLVASAVRGILAQRLIRKICDECKEAYNPTDEEAARIQEYYHIDNFVPFFRGRGCSSCDNTGYKGRVPIYEYLEMTPVIRRAIINKASEEEIRSVAISEGMRLLKEYGLMKVLQGVTTMKELFRVTNQ
jgi:type II secretory ATPase GspE/PulE/Tfp pilus assembly ATPase PilB-like protein